MTQTGVILGTILTHTGKLVQPMDLRVEDIDPTDIAHSLSNIARYNGHSDHLLTVAEHSVRCARRLPKGHPDRPWVLMHDAPEAYLGDLIAPLKYLPEFEFYRLAEERAMEVICQRFGLPLEEPECVHEIDMAMRATEMRDLKRPLPKWKQKDMPAPYPFKIVPWTPTAARAEFVKEMKACKIK
jgi:5'-deoxynucleotidase YfbR-like HD superfamily hydrolase